MFVIEKVKHGIIHSEEHGWLLVRFDGCRFLVPVQSCEVQPMESKPSVTKVKTRQECTAGQVIISQPRDLSR